MDSFEALSYLMRLNFEEDKILPKMICHSQCNLMQVESSNIYGYIFFSCMLTISCISEVMPKTDDRALEEKIPLGSLLYCVLWKVIQEGRISSHLLTPIIALYETQGLCRQYSFPIIPKNNYLIIISLYLIAVSRVTNDPHWKRKH